MSFYALAAVWSIVWWIDDLRAMGPESKFEFKQQGLLSSALLFKSLPTENFMRLISATCFDIIF